jgi:HlyD family secretion protein
MKTTWIRRGLFWGAVVAVVVILFWWMTRTEPVTVTTVRAERGLVEQVVANTRAGTVKACQRAKLSLQVGGQIAVLLVKEGDHVKPGALLMELWNRDLKAMLREAELAAESAHLDHDAICIRARHARREAERLDRLEAKKLVSEESADQARSEAQAAAVSCAAAGSREQQAAAMVTVAKAALEKTRLHAPFAGVVAEVTGEVGEYTTPSPPGVATPPAIDLLTDDCYYVVAPIDEVDAVQLERGKVVRISFDAYRGRSFPGRLTRIAPYVLDREKQARTVEVEVAFSKPMEIPLFAGYSVDVEIVLETRDNTLRLPTEAVLEERFVLLFHEHRPLEKREIEPGLSNWRHTEVLSGLNPGDEVVTSLGRDRVRAGVVVVRE